jgi:hypothetical protein
MTPDPAGMPANGDLTYTYRPTLLGAPWSFSLTEHGMDWSAGSRSGCVRYRDVRRLRQSFKPKSMQAQRFLTEIWADGAPRLEIVSSSWKSMVEQERQDAPYAAFIAELNARVARAGTPVRYDRGANPFGYWLGVALYAMVAVALAVVSVRAVQSHALGAAAFIGAFVAIFLWQGGTYLLRNRPGTYSPDALPRDLMPRLKR